MSYLIDVNVWLALLSERHQHHGAAPDWFERAGEREAVLCRVTQMGFLRLLTRRAVMQDDVVEPAEAIRVATRLRADDRVVFASEPQGLEKLWFEKMHAPHTGSGSWTDAYLAAFAESYGLTLISMDGGFGRWASLDFLHLKP